MPKIKITFDKDWDIDRRMQAISQRREDLKDCLIIKMELQKIYKQVGVVEFLEKREWNGVEEMGLMLKTANYLMIKYEHKN